GVWGADYKGWIFNYEEDYSFIKEYLNLLNIPKTTKLNLIKLLENYRKAHRAKDKNLIRSLRKKIDIILKPYNLSLQFFRFKRVRENLKKRIVLENMKRIATKSP
ncbi:hypothetical protein, partial [Aquifex sp.]